MGRLGELARSPSPAPRVVGPAEQKSAGEAGQEGPGALTVQAGEAQPQAREALTVPGEGRKPSRRPGVSSRRRGVPPQHLSTCSKPCNPESQPAPCCL